MRSKFIFKTYEVCRSNTVMVSFMFTAFCESVSTYLSKGKEVKNIFLVQMRLLKA